MQVASGLGVLVYVPLVVAFVMWVHRVVANSGALGAQGLRFTPGWAVGWWFIPFASFVQPERVIEETWRVTTTPRPSTPAARHDAPKVVLVRWWWAFWLVSNLSSWVLLSITTQMPTLADIQDHTVTQIVVYVLQVIAAGFAVAVVRSLTARQDRLHAGRV